MALTDAERERMRELSDRHLRELSAHHLVPSTFNTTVYCTVCGHGGCEDLTDYALTEEEERELVALGLKDLDIEGDN